MAEGLLAEIAIAKRSELDRRFDGVSLDALRASAAPTSVSLADTLAKEGARFILEIKKASPSSGEIRLDADPGDLARSYSGVADALSVLCDRQYFHGSLADLSAARREFDGPILAKDFFIDIRQVAQARLAGADAVLVMLSLLDDEGAREMIAEARRLGMDAIVEVHSESEMRRALALECTLIGINNRDLRDFTIDLGTTRHLSRLAPDRLLVSESGISNRTHVEALAPLVDGFLIGSSLMRSRDPARAARELVFGLTKLCGLNCDADVGAARPAAFAGFVFVPGSPRQVTVDEAGPLAGIAQRMGISPVGVFRNEPLQALVEAACELNLHAVQLHGTEDEDYVRLARRALPSGCEIWTAIDVGRDELVSRGGERLLFDNGRGGSGQAFNWQLVRGHRELASAIIAGGIGPANAAAAKKLGAFAIDVGSSVEVRPGRKSPEKIASVFEALRPPSGVEVIPCV